MIDYLIGDLLRATKSWRPETQVETCVDAIESRSNPALETKTVKSNEINYFAQYDAALEADRD